MSVFLVSHQEDRFHVFIQLTIGHHHGELASDIRQRPDAAHHNPRTTTAHKLHRQAIKAFDIHVVYVLHNLFNQLFAFAGSEQRLLFGIEADADDQFIEQLGSALYDVQMPQGYGSNDPV